MPKPPKQESLYVGVDGEGQGRTDHRYVFLAASTKTGDRSWSVESDSWEEAWGLQARDSKTGEVYTTYHDSYRGLHTGACLDFLLALPRRTKAFAYAFNYDETMALRELPNESLYYLFRPEDRPAGSKSVGAAAAERQVSGHRNPRTGANKKGSGPEPVAYKWKKTRYWINLQGTKLTLRANKKSRILWDIFKFYQGKFVGACESWKVGTQAERDAMDAMKGKRGEFERESPEDVRRYCLKETCFMAELAEKLVAAHDHPEVNLPLKSFYGAGSSASAMLLSLGIKEKIQGHDGWMHEAVAMAFFGGRFENSVVGAIRQTIYNYDISSAYPYQITFLPCFQHGNWRRTTDRRELEKVRAALVCYKLHGSSVAPAHRRTSWGPFPYRTSEGSICFPSESGGGWVYKDEYLAGEKFFPGVEFIEAYVFDWTCECKPFEKVPPYYLQRLALGKEAAGIVLKLGLNSCYGKLAQSIGSALFNCWLWAGLITSGCRAQLLTLLGQHKDWSNALMMATDGLGTLEKLSPPAPDDTGTDIEVTDRSNGETNRKPLGGWEEKVNKKGMFLARPGIYFPLDPTEKEKNAVRARGVGRKVIFDQWERIVRTWEEKGMDGMVRVDDVARFCGAKTSIHRSGQPGSYRYTRANGGRGAAVPSYGNWIVRHVDMSFNPKPKRECLEADGLHLRLRKMPMDMMSEPYKNVLDDEAKQIKAFTEEMAEQPDVDYSEFSDLETLMSE